MENLKNSSRMKERFIYILIMVLSLTFVSCDRDDSMPTLMEYPVTVEVDAAMTKVGIDGNSLFWQSGDQLQFRATGVSGTTATAVLTLNDVDSGLGTAKFRGTVTMSEQPVRCEFAYNSSSFADGGKVLFDYSVQDGTHKPYLYGVADYSANGINCRLDHVGGLLRIKVPANVTSLSLSSNSGVYYTNEDGTSGYNGQPIAMVESAADGFVPKEDSSHLISVAVPSGAETVYVFAPAVEYIDGVSIVCSHSDGSKMFKSFSKTGGKASGYNLAAGAVLDLDLGEYKGFTADCTCSWQHVYEGTGRILTGTTVSLTGFTFSGAPVKVIDQWGAAVYDPDGNFVRWVSWTSEEGPFTEGSTKLMTDYAGNWPLLVPNKEYTVYAICSINGHTLSFPSKTKISVGYPDITVTPIAETSWSYRNDPQKANACGNNTIERLGLKVSVSNNISSSPNYGFKARIKNETQSFDTQDISMAPQNTSSGLNMAFNESTGEYELKNSDGGMYKLGNLEWKTHKVTASVSFAGKTYAAASSVSAFVTGLPYRHDFKTNQSLDEGVIQGDSADWHKYNGLELRYYYYYYIIWPYGKTEYKRTYYSRTFPLPETAIVQFTSTFRGANTGQPSSSGTYTVYSGIVTSTSAPSTMFSKSNISTDSPGEGFNVDNLANAQAKIDHSVTGTGMFSSQSRISASTNDGDFDSLIENGVYLGYMEILYHKE